MRPANSSHEIDEKENTMVSNLNYKHAAGRAQEDACHLIAAAAEHIERARVSLASAAHLLFADDEIRLLLRLALRFVPLAFALKQLSAAFSEGAE